MIATKSPETIALEMLTFIVGDETELGRFLALSGLTPSDLRQKAGDLDTLRSVIDYVLGHEPTARAFAESYGYRPEQLAQAAHRLGASTP